MELFNGAEHAICVCLAQFDRNFTFATRLTLLQGLMGRWGGSRGAVLRGLDVLNSFHAQPYDIRGLILYAFALPLWEIKRDSQLFRPKALNPMK